MKPYGNVILMTAICIAIFTLFMALRPAHADEFVVLLQKDNEKPSAQGWDCWGNQVGLFDAGAVATRRQPSRLTDAPVLPF
jgi:hypothetical protein